MNAPTTFQNVVANHPEFIDYVNASKGKSKSPDRLTDAKDFKYSYYTCWSCGPCETIDQIITRIAEGKPKPPREKHTKRSVFDRMGFCVEAKFKRLHYARRIEPDFENLPPEIDALVEKQLALMTTPRHAPTESPQELLKELSKDPGFVVVRVPMLN
jgi:hypothetical protein